jgi:glutathione peroxidase
VSFPIMSKIEVNGANEHPVYNFLKSKKSGMLGLTRIKWNFEKFLVDKQGQVVERYSSLTKPEELEAKIVELLNK